MLWVSLVWPFTFYLDPDQHTVYTVGVYTRETPSYDIIFTQDKTAHDIDSPITNYKFQNLKILECA